MVSIDWAAFYIPHPDKAEKGGEDAYFYSEENDFSTAAVFDGVGSWNDDGVDPKKWADAMARNTMEHMQSEAGIITALDQAYDETLK